MSNFLKWLLVPALLVSSVRLYSQQEIGTKRLLPKTFIDSLKQQKIRNIFSTERTLRLMSDIPAAMLARPLQEVVSLYCNNQMLVSRWQDRTFNIGPTALGDSVLQGHYRAVYITDPEGEPVYHLEVTTENGTGVQYTDQQGLVLLKGALTGETLLIRGGKNWPDTMITFTDSPVEQVELQPKTLETIYATATIKTGFGNVRGISTNGIGYKQGEGVSASCKGDKVTDALERVPGYLPVDKSVPGKTSSTGSFMGPGTIRGNKDLLFVVENQVMPDINMLNPNDIDSITVIRDPTWMALYGVRGANGIVVIKLKESKANKFRLSFKTQVAFSTQPDIYANPVISPADYIRMEEENFANGAYLQRERNNLPLSPIVEALIKLRDSAITKTQYDNIAAYYRTQDVRDYLARLYYRPAMRQQYYLNGAAGFKEFKYYFSIGHNRNVLPELGNDGNRSTFLFSTQYTHKKISWRSRYQLSMVQNNRNPFVMPVAIPYLPLVDAHNNPLAVPYYGRSSYLDTVAGGRYLPYDLRPVQEWDLNNNKEYGHYLSLNQALSYKPFAGLEVNGLYQYTLSTTATRVLYDPESYFVRDQMNRNAKLMNGVMQWDLPAGAMMDKADSRTVIHDARVQVDYNWKWRNLAITSFAGGETQSLRSYYDNSRLYAYGTALQQVVTDTTAADTTNFFVAGYLGNNITINNRLFFSMGIRADQTNRFGPKPLLEGLYYSAGARAQLDRFSFYPDKWPFCSLSAAMGELGNDNPELQKITSIRAAGINSYRQAVAGIDQSAAGALRAERTKLINIGARVTTRDSVFTVSFDYSWRNGSNLAGQQKVNPTAGYDAMVTNNSSLKGQGFNFSAEARYGQEDFRQETRCWVSGYWHKITSDEMAPDEVWKNFEPATYTPQRGQAVNGILAYPLAPLDSITGNPVGYIGDQPSKDYKAITGSKDPSSLRYIGSAIPLYYGSLTHTFKLYGLAELSFQVSGRFKYFYRSLSYSAAGLINSTNDNGDYNDRFQQKGDEKNTTVPSFQLTEDKAREQVYQYGDVLVRPADQVRLEYVQVGFIGDKKNFKFLQSNSLLFYFTICNLGILWRKNRQRQDPDAVGNAYPVPRSYCFTVKLML